VQPAAACTVYLARLAELRPWHRQTLDAAESQRAARFRLEADRERFVLATAVLRTAAAGLLGCTPAAVPLDRGCEHCGRQHGRPRLPGTGLQASISHSGDVAAVALTAGQPVGVDVEAITGRAYEPLLDRVCTAAERPFVRSAADFCSVWARKEAVLKATGEGLRTPMTSVSLTPPQQPPELLDLAGARPACRLADIPAGLGYAAAAAVLCPDPVAFEVRDGAAARP